MCTVFVDENEFEDQVVANLRNNGWGAMPVLKYKTEDLVYDASFDIKIAE